MTSAPDANFTELRGRYVVLKVGGSADVRRGQIGTDIRTLVDAGVRVVVAHGGGDALSAYLQERGHMPTWVDGLRVTDAATRDAAVVVFRDMVAPALIEDLTAAGVSAFRIAGDNPAVVRVEQQSPELGYVGRVTQVERSLLDELTARGHVPVLAPLGLGPEGEIYNVNGDEIAEAVARSVSAAVLLFLTDVPAVRDADGQPIHDLSAGRAVKLIQAGIIRDGMVPKVRAAIGLLDDVDAVWIADGRRPNALRQALLDRVAGTRIVA